MATHSDPILVNLIGDSEAEIDLGETRIVDLLVRGFSDQCLDAFRLVLRNELSQDEAVNRIEGVAIALNALFLGEGGFESVIPRPWNTPEQLGSYLQDILALDAAAEESVRALLIRLATRIMEALQRKEADWPLRLTPMIDETRELLLGQRRPGAPLFGVLVN